MRIECCHCNTTITYQDSVPKFCSECGCSLSSSGSIGTIQEDVTIARSPGSSTPASRSQDHTHPVSPADIEKYDLKTVGPYRLVRKLGQGGMGTVYEAAHVESGRNVALKLLSPEVRGTDEMVQRFRRESQIAASINHPRSTFVYEAGEHDGQLYITMELMGGGTLKDMVVEDGPLPVGRAVDYVIDVIDGLMVAHQHGIVHRDLKPSNSFIDTDGRIKVGDFGLAKSFVGDSNLTATGTFMGTPQYAAPEQIRNDNVDERTDIYALGGTLFYLLTGRAPFEGNPAQVISSIASETPPRVNKFAKDIPKPLVRLIAQTLEKDPERRPYNLSMLRDGLLPFSTRGATAAEPGRRLAAYFADTVVLAFCGTFIAMVLGPLLMFLVGLVGGDANLQHAAIFLATTTTILYYSVAESVWGRTIGKWIFGLRLIDSQGQSPSFFPALGRALLLPGIGIIVAQGLSISFFDPEDPIGTSVRSNLVSQIGWIPPLIMVMFGRASNGYQCLHGWLTGTRVVKLSGDLESRLLDQFEIFVPERLEVEQTRGSYKLVGKYNENLNGVSTYLAKDAELDRPIWLFDGFESPPMCEKRRHLTRSSRLKLIGQYSEQERHWYTTESTPGTPLIDVIRYRRCEWRSILPLIRDVCSELENSIEEGHLPQELSLEHLWLDHTGRLCLLDHALLNPRGKSVVSTDDVSDESVAIRLIKNLLEEFVEHQDHPISVMNLIDRLDSNENVPGTLAWLGQELMDSSEKPTSWNALDRIGMLAISLGIEYSPISAVMFVTGMLLVTSGMDAPRIIGMTLLSGLFVVAIYGLFFRGGPAMQISGVELRKKSDKGPATKLQMVLRSLFAWLPWVFATTIILYPVVMKFKEDPKVTQVNFDNSDLLGAAILLSLVPIGIGLLGALAAAWNPPRGIPDWITSTRLMRK